MSCGCKGNGATPSIAQQAQAQAQAAENVAGKASVNFQITMGVTLNPCEECAKNGDKPFTIQFSAATGHSVDKYADRLDVLKAAMFAAAEAAKATHEAH